MRRGEVWTGNLNPNRGAEVGKIRPVLILQEDALTAAGLPTLVVLPLTTQVRPALQRLRIGIPARDRLRQDCQIMVDQPRTLDRQRLADGPLTVITVEELGRVEQGLRFLLGLI